MNKKAELRALNDLNFDEEVRKSEGRFLVEISAKWCGPCRQMAPLLHQLADERAATLKVGVLDMDSAVNVATQLGVRGAPTFIVFENGKEIARQLGAVPPTVLRALVDRQVA